MDFFSAEVWTPKGLTTYYVLFVIELETRRVHLAAITTNPDGAFMAQIARNLTDTVDGFLARHRFLICDRDGKFTPQFKRILDGTTAASDGDVLCSERLGGLIKHYHRAA